MEETCRVFVTRIEEICRVFVTRRGETSRVFVTGMEKCTEAHADFNFIKQILSREIYQCVL
jgi:hypothetical protein